MEPTVATEAVGRMKAGRPGGCSKGDETNPARARSRDFLLHRAGKRRGGAGGREKGPGENGGWQVSVFWRRESSRRGAICLSTPSGPVVALGWARLAGHFGSGANLGSTAPGCENWAWPQLRPSTAPAFDCPGLRLHLALTALLVATSPAIAPAHLIRDPNPAPHRGLDSPPPRPRSSPVIGPKASPDTPPNLLRRPPTNACPVESPPAQRLHVFAS